MLDLYLTTCPDLCTATVSSHFGRSDHCMVSVVIDVQCKQSTDVPFHRTVYRYSKADWDGFRSFIADAPLNYIFKFRASKIASLITDWVSSGMDTFIPHKNTNKSQILSPGSVLNVLLQ